MPALFIQDVPDEIYAALERVAVLNRRSVQQEVILRLASVRLDEQTAPLARAEALRARLSGRPIGDTVAEIRAERLR